MNRYRWKKLFGVEFHDHALPCPLRGAAANCRPAAAEESLAHFLMKCRHSSECDCDCGMDNIPSGCTGSLRRLIVQTAHTDTGYLFLLV
jgi:hypothetical protein